MLNVSAVKGAIQDSDADAIIISQFERSDADTPPNAILTALDEASGGAVSKTLELDGFSGKAGEVATVYPRSDSLKTQRVIVVGLGSESSFNAEGARRAAARAVQRAKALKLKRVASVIYGAGVGALSLEAAAQAVTEGSVLGLYDYRGQKSGEAPALQPETLDLLIADDAGLAAAQAGVRAGLATAEGVGLTRDLVNLPPNICTPEYLAQVAAQVGSSTGLKVETLDRRQMEMLKMGALLGVAQGSSAEPRFIILEHNAARASELDTLVLVGKGVTFDTGGYSLKDRDGMVGMKADMAGGGAVIGALLALARLNVPLHVVGLVPAADNMISDKAYRPNEVLTASNGVTIEIISTDAEGRLLLADALVYAGRYKPAAVVDIATLTGSMAVALGGAAAGFFCTDAKLRDALVAAGAATHERVWEMPLYEDYNKPLESLTADTKNSGSRYGGACQAALFLKRFTDYPAWAHVDIAGVAGIETMGGSSDVPYISKGGTGYGVRLFVELARRWAAAQAQ